MRHIGILIYLPQFLFADVPTPQEVRAFAESGQREIVLKELDRGYASISVGPSPQSMRSYRRTIRALDRLRQPTFAVRLVNDKPGLIMQRYADRLIVNAGWMDRADTCQLLAVVAHEAAHDSEDFVRSILISESERTQDEKDALFLKLELVADARALTLLETSGIDGSLLLEALVTFLPRTAHSDERIGSVRRLIRARTSDKGTDATRLECRNEPK